MERCGYNYDCYGCNQMHILMMKDALFYNSIPICAETKTHSRWLDYQNQDLY